MTAELEGYRDQLLSIQQDTSGIVANLSDDQFNWRPAANRWSIGECFDHLNATARAYMPAIDRAIATARGRGLKSPGPFSYSLFERLFLRWNEPPPKLRLPAPKVLKPAAGRPLEPVIRDFMGWQEQLADRIRIADGLDLSRARSRAPALPLFK